MQNIVRLIFVNNICNLIFRQEINFFETDFDVFIMIKSKIGVLNVYAFNKVILFITFKILDKMMPDKTYD